MASPGAKASQVRKGGILCGPYTKAGSGECSASNPPEKDSARAQCVHAEDFARIAAIKAPVVHDQQNLGAEIPARVTMMPRFPGVLGVDAEPLGIADAQQQAEQNAGCHEESIRGQAKVTDLEESGIHRSVLALKHLDARYEFKDGSRNAQAEEFWWHWLYELRMKSLRLVYAPGSAIKMNEECSYRKKADPLGRVEGRF